MSLRWAEGATNLPLHAAQISTFLQVNTIPDHSGQTLASQTPGNQLIACTYIHTYTHMMAWTAFGQRVREKLPQQRMNEYSSIRSGNECFESTRSEFLALLLCAIKTGPRTATCDVPQTDRQTGFGFRKYSIR